MVFYPNEYFLNVYLRNVYRHLMLNYDNVLIIAGDTGTGKSMLGLHLIEFWYTIILKKKISVQEMKDRIQGDYKEWIRKFSELERYDLTILDEASLALDSKDWASKLSKTLEKLYNICRSKNFFTIIILPSFFNLNKYFREHRVRSLIYIPRRGEYHFYSKKQIGRINSANERIGYKNLARFAPFIKGTFPDFTGELRKLYDKSKDENVDKYIQEIIEELESSTKKRKNKKEKKLKEE